MKKIFTLLLTLLVTTSLFAIKVSGKIGPNATWNYNTGTYVLRISGTGATYDGSYSYNGMYQAAPKRRNVQEAAPTGVITFKYGAEINGDAYIFNIDDVQKIVVEEGITKLGEWTFAFFHNVQTVRLPSTLTNLGGGAFLDNTNLTQIIIPENVDTMKAATCISENSIYGDNIDYGAFSGCTNLTTVYWNVRGTTNGNIIQPLMGLEDVTTKIVLGETVEHIPEMLCVNFKKINGELVVAKNVKTIGYAAFAGCSGINKITILADSLETKPTPFRSPGPPFSYAITNNHGAPFAMCSKNMEIFIGKDVQYIGEYMFSNYDKTGHMNKAQEFYYDIEKNDYVDSVHVTFEAGSTLKAIGRYAFAGVKGLDSFELPATIRTIMPFAFYDTDLKSVTIPDSLEEIGGNAFGSCPELSNIQYNAINATIVSANYSDTRYSYNPWRYYFQSPFINCSKQLNIVIGKDVKNIPSFMFMGGARIATYDNNAWSYTLSIQPRTDIKNITLEENNNLKDIASYAFAGCSAITDFDFSQTTSIGEYAFAQTGFKKVTIPKNISYLYPYAFDHCPIDTVYFNSIRCWNTSHTDWDARLAKYASPFSNGSDTTVFIIGETATSIPAFIFSKYEYQSPLDWTDVNQKPTLTKSTRNHYKIQFAPNSTVNEIGMYAFAGNMVMENLKIPYDCRSIGAYAFADCENLTNIKMKDSLASVYTTDIEANIFAGCNQIRNVEWNIASSTFESIEETPFHHCAANIESFCIGNKVWKIPAYLCADMTSLKSMSLPEKISSIEDSAFYNCTNVDTFYVSSSYPAQLGEDAFPSSAKIKVKCRSKEEYLSDTHWNVYNILSECSLSNFTIQFYNWDGTLLQRSEVLENTMPVYEGEIPTREEDELFTYVFKGWSPEIVPVTTYAIYYATFEATYKEQDIENTQEDLVQNTKILRNGQLLIIRDGKTYTVTGMEVR